MLKAATKARRHEESQRTFRVFVAAFFRELREPGVQPSGFSVVSAFRRTVRIVRASASCFRVFVVAVTYSNPSRPAWATAADRDETSSFVRVLATCRWTVCSLMKSRSAIA